MKRISLDIPGATINFYAEGPPKEERSPLALENDASHPTGVLAIQIIPSTPHMETVVRKGLQAGRGVVLSLPGEVAVKLLMPAISVLCAEIMGLDPEAPEIPVVEEPTPS